MTAGMIGIFQEIVTLFVIVGVGYAAKRLRFMNDEFDRMLSKLVINIALPGMILGSVLTATELPTQTEVWLCLGLSVASNLVMFAVAYAFTLLMRIPDGHRGVYRFMLCFGNVGFIGYPVLSAVFGPDALVYAAVFNLPFNFFVFTVGAWFLTQDTDGDVKVQTTWRTFVTPVMLSCVAAVLLTLGGIHYAPILGDALNTLGSITTPAALLIIGSSLANLPVHDLIGGPRLSDLLGVPSARDAGHHLGRLPRIRAGGTHVLGGRGAGGNARGHQRHHALLPVWRQLPRHGPGNFRHHRAGYSEHPHPGRLRRRGDLGNRTTTWEKQPRAKTTATMRKHMPQNSHNPASLLPTFGNPPEHRARDSLRAPSSRQSVFPHHPSELPSRERHLRRLRLFRRPPRSLRQRKPFRQAHRLWPKRPPRETPRSRIGPVNLVVIRCDR